MTEMTKVCLTQEKGKFKNVGKEEGTIEDRPPQKNGSVWMTDSSTWMF